MEENIEVIWNPNRRAERASTPREFGGAEITIDYTYRTYMNSILEGFASIGRGLAAILGYPYDLRDDPEVRRILDTSDEEALREDWDTVMEDYRKVWKSK